MSWEPCDHGQWGRRETRERERWRQRDRGTERRKDREIEGQRDGEKETLECVPHDGVGRLWLAGDTRVRVRVRDGERGGESNVVGSPRSDPPRVTWFLPVPL